MITMRSGQHCVPVSCVLCAAALSALFAGCAVGPNFVQPTPQVPAHWSARAISAPAAAQPLPAEQSAPPQPLSAASEQSAQQPAWWAAFNDPVLTSLVERGRSSNLDLRVAVLRIEEARAQRDVTAAGFWPTLSAEASYSRQRLSETTPTGSLFSSVGNIRLPGGAGISIPNPYSQYQLSADASWEIDLFGRIRRAVEAADASVQVSIEDQRAVLVSVLADVAQDYIELRGAQSRLLIVRENLATIDELLELVGQTSRSVHFAQSFAAAAHRRSVRRQEPPKSPPLAPTRVPWCATYIHREPGFCQPAVTSPRRCEGSHRQKDR